MSTVLITGANRGIGLELCRQYKQRNDRVIAVCRQSSSELNALDVEVRDGVDVTEEGSVNTFASALQGVKLDTLINNAGILSSETLASLDFDYIRRQFEVNTLGPLRVTVALLKCLKPGSKVAIVSSRMGSIADNTSGGYYGYRMSKAAVNMAGVSLAQDLHERGIAVVLLHPGMVATEMTGRTGIPPEEAASGLIARIDEVDLQHSGYFWHASGERLSW
ncbi:MAG: SDR family oxidoreductase [Gammaproteobacteria bacterium]|nr:SDR family oxidoreductase [Gammaproteobacteria bacterium]